MIKHSHCKHLAIKAGCLLALILLQGCQTLQSVDRSIYKATEVISERDRVTGARSISIADRNKQIAQGNALAERYIAEAKKAGKRVNSDYSASAYQRILRIFDRLQQVSHLSEERWTPVLIEDNSWNAFTTGGTYFVIFSGLERELRDDNELAQVIAHEMAHTAANHPFEMNSFLQLNALAGSKSASRQSFQAAFTHENEREADRLGILYCALAGFDPFAASRIWQRMTQQSGNDAAFIHTHPMNSQRQQEAQQTAGKVVAYYSPGRINPNADSLKNNNSLFNQRQETVKAGEGGGVLSLLDTVLTTYEQKEQAKAEEARQLQRIQYMHYLHDSTSLLDSRAIARHQWQITLVYNGNHNIDKVVMKLLIQQKNSQAPFVAISPVNAIIYPGRRFRVIFDTGNINAYGLSKEQVNVQYDSAQAL